MPARAGASRSSPYSFWTGEPWGGPDTETKTSAAPIRLIHFGIGVAPEALEAFQGGPSKWLPRGPELDSAKENGLRVRGRVAARGRPKGAILFERPDRSRRGRRGPCG